MTYDLRMFIAVAEQPRDRDPAISAFAMATTGDLLGSVAAIAEVRTRPSDRLHRVEGQLRNAQFLVEGDFDRTVILAEFAAVQDALRAVSRETGIIERNP